MSSTYRPFQCADCGVALSQREVANESATYVAGTARSRVRSIRRYCAECHANNEWKRQQAIQANVEATLAKLPEAVRAAYLASEAARS